MGVILLAVAGFARCDFSDDPQESATAIQGSEFRNLADTVEYVGMETCRKCHENVYQSYIRTGMGQSFGEATKDRSAASFEDHEPVYDVHSDLYYKPWWQGDSLVVLEYRLEGKDTVHKRLQPVDFIIGSGHHTNSHIYSVNGYLYQAPFTWYVQEEQLDLPPGYEDGRNTRFSREIGFECMTCHNAYPKFDKGSENRFTHMPDGIDCERCHGPGSLHVQEKLEGKLVDITNDTDFSIVNPAKLPLELQTDVCQRCHLQGNAVLKEGKDFDDFRPGMKLSDVMEVFLPKYEETEDRFIMASHADRMKMSPCFTETQEHKTLRPLNCISCHNPHVSVKGTKQQHFVNACLTCHTEPDDECEMPLQQRIVSNNNNCISCHMPPSNTIDIPHVTITDHFIRVRDGKDPLPSVSPSDLKVAGLRSTLSQNPDPAVTARAYLFYYEKFEPRPFLLDSAFHYLSPLSKERNYALWISFLYLKNEFRGLIEMAEEVRPAGVVSALTHYQTGQAYQNSGIIDKARNHYQEAVEKQPRNLDYRNKLGTTLLILGDTAQARKEFQFVLKENPQMVIAANNLGFIELLAANVNKAEQLFDRAVSLDPDYTTARINKLKVYIYRGQIEEAKRLALQILDKEPANAEARQLLQLISNSPD